MEKIAYSVKEIADALGVSDQTIYNAIKQGSFPGHKVGNGKRARIVVMISDFETWKAAGNILAS